MKKKNPLLAPLAAGFLIGVIAVGAVVLVKNHADSNVPTFVMSSPAPRANPATANAAGATLSTSAPTMPLMVSTAANPAVTRVATRFTCACGQCEDRLDTCNCETAQSERDFIQRQLQQGHNEADTVKALNHKYGGLKS